MFKTLLLCLNVIPFLLFLSSKKEDSITNSTIEVDVLLSWKSSYTFTLSSYSPSINSNIINLFESKYIKLNSKINQIYL